MKDDRPRLLVVADVADCADCLGMLLEMWGYQVEVAHGGHGALETARAFRPQAAVLDLWMPGMDGLRLRGDARAAGAAGAPSSRSQAALTRRAARGPPGAVEGARSLLSPAVGG